MKTEKGQLNIKDWNEFTVPSTKSKLSAIDLYENFKTFKERFEKLPKKELIKRGWITSTTDMASLSGMLNDINAERGSALFRKSDTANTSLCSLWLSKIKSDAELQVITTSIPSFQGLSKIDLITIAKLSVNTELLTSLQGLLYKKGVVLIYNRALPAMKLDGVVFKLASGNPVIGMSLRFSRLDNFWFTLMHELSHIFLHFDLLDSPILDDLEIETENEIEIAANRLAQDSFVDRRIWRTCEPKYDNSANVLERFANEIGVHKSIVAGMLRKETGDYSIYSSIVNEINVREIIFGHD